MVIGGDARSQRVVIAGTEYTLRPMATPVIPGVVRIAGDALDAVFAGESRTLRDWLPVLETHGPALREAVALASGIPQAVVDELDAVGFLQLADVMLDLNLDFFVQRARPAMGRMLATVGRIAQRASSARLPATLRH